MNTDESENTDEIEKSRDSDKNRDYCEELDVWCKENGYYSQYGYMTSLNTWICNCSLQTVKNYYSDKYTVFMAEGKTEYEAKQIAAKICLQLIADDVRVQPGYEHFQKMSDESDERDRQRRRWEKELEEDVSESYWSWCNIL